MKLAAVVEVSDAESSGIAAEHAALVARAEAAVDAHVQPAFLNTGGE
jgi:hypothetical protein